MITEIKPQKQEKKKRLRGFIYNIVKKLKFPLTLDHSTAHMSVDTVIIKLRPFLTFYYILQYWVDSFHLAATPGKLRQKWSKY